MELQDLSALVVEQIQRHNPEKQHLHLDYNAASSIVHGAIQKTLKRNSLQHLLDISDCCLMFGDQQVCSWNYWHKQRLCRNIYSKASTGFNRMTIFCVPISQYSIWCSMTDR